MTTTTSEIETGAAAAVLDRAAEALVARQRADVALLVAAVEWAELHQVASRDEAACWGEPAIFEEGASMLGDPGAPLIAEFAPLALAAELGWTTAAATELMGHGLDLKYRLPRVWTMVLQLTVPVSVARQAAQLSHDLPTAVALDADRKVAAWAAAGGRSGYLSRRRIAVLVNEVRLYHDPDRAVDDEQQALAARKVESWPGITPATTDIHMRLDTADADAFTEAVGRVAETLAELGDEDPLEIRRARAVGVLADPPRALDLLTRGTDPGPRTRTPTSLWLHLSDTSLLDIDMYGGAVVSERLGVVTTDLVKAWLADSTVVLQPVLHDTCSDAVDQHDPPAWMADQVRLRDPVCVFPGCRRPSRACDLDHIEAYLPLELGGPPGQTSAERLAPLCRHHHRAKTHGGWRYRRRLDGSYRWTSPSGRTYDVLPPPRAL